MLLRRNNISLYFELMEKLMALDANDSLLRYDAPEKDLYEIGEKIGRAHV